jgi:hypothetical protein
MRFDRLQALVRLDGLRAKRTSTKRLRKFSDNEHRLEKYATVTLAGLAEDGLFEPLNREERRLFEKLARRGQLTQWYTRRLQQVGESRLIPYVREWMSAPRKARGMRHLSFWWRRRRAGLPVRLEERPSGVTAYSRMAYLREREPRKSVQPRIGLEREGWDIPADA